MDHPLLERAQAALEESRRLGEVRDKIFKDMTDIAIHRLIVARVNEQAVIDAEEKVVKASTEALRIARL